MGFLIRTKNLSGLLVSLIAVTALLFSRRSVWIDEAMLLRNIFETDFFDLVHPLHYYDQASPFFSTAIIKVFTILSRENIVITRLLVFFFVALSAAPSLLELKRRYGLLSVNIFLLSSLAASYSVINYATELKHYGFEIAAVFIFIYWFVIYLNTPDQAFKLRYFLILTLSISLGFSSLLLVVALFIYFLIEIFTKKESGNYPKKRIFKYFVPLVILTTVSIAVYLHMKHLTQFQMSNYADDYETKSLFETIDNLESLVVEAYGVQFILAIVLSSLVACATLKDSMVYRVNLLFLLLVVIVLSTKLLGIYPVFRIRHIVWITPFGLAIIAMTLPSLLSSKVKTETALGVFILLLLFYQAMVNLYQLQRGDICSRASNQSLYEYLAYQPPNDVFVLSFAEPSLYIYQRIMKNLDKHKYYGLISPVTGTTPPKMKVMSAFSTIYDKPGVWSTFSVFNKYNDATPLTNWQITQIPNRKNFLLLMSHTEHIDAEPVEFLIRSLRKSLDSYGCNYVSLFKGKEVQLLKVSCQH